MPYIYGIYIHGIQIKKRYRFHLSNGQRQVLNRKSSIGKAIRNLAGSDQYCVSWYNLCGRQFYTIEFFKVFVPEILLLRICLKETVIEIMQ